MVGRVSQSQRRMSPGPTMERSGAEAMPVGPMRVGQPAAPVVDLVAEGVGFAVNVPGAVVGVEVAADDGVVCAGPGAAMESAVPGVACTPSDGRSVEVEDVDVQ